ncbi:MAG: hypothetical protein HC945_03765 [Nitrosarchaeum sp.]|nr:hypothetical protein [Nitrosarchaeum sp.]
MEEEIRATRVEEGWREALLAIRQRGVQVTGSDGRSYVELANLVLVVTDPADDIGRPIEMMQEFGKWVYPRKEEIAQIITSRRDQSALEYLYGPRIFSYQRALNQIDDFVLPLLRKDPTSRRGIVGIYDPVLDSRLENREAPSLLSLHFRVLQNAVHVTALIRSNDMFIGWPANVYQVYDLLRFVAGGLGIRTGSLTTVSLSAHVYDEHASEVGKVLSSGF